MKTTSASISLRRLEQKVRFLFIVIGCPSIFGYAPDNTCRLGHSSHGREKIKQPGMVEKILVKGDSNVEYSPILFWILRQNRGDCWVELQLVEPTISHYQQKMPSESFRESCTCTT